MSDERYKEMEELAELIGRLDSFAADNPMVDTSDGYTKYIARNLQCAGYRQIPELTVLSEKEILESLIGASIPPSVDYEIEHLVAQAQLAHTKRELGE